MEKLNSDEKIELDCRTNEESSQSVEESTLDFKLIVNNGTKKDRSTTDKPVDDHSDEDCKLHNGLKNLHEDSIKKLSADSLQIKQPFKEIDLNDNKIDESNETLSDESNSDNQINNTVDMPVQSCSPNILSSDHTYLNQNEILKNSIKLFRCEFRRLGFNEKHWRYTSYNKNFTLCSTYPPYFIVPAQFADEDLNEVAKFRHMGRLPSVVYRHRNGAVIVRSSQPSVGLLSRRSTEDEKLLQLIFANCIQDQSELIEKSNSFEDNSSCNELANCDCCDSNSSTPKLKLNGHHSNQTNNEPREYCCNCNCHSQDAVINLKNCHQPTQSSKFFSLSDKIFENIMSYASYTEVANETHTTATNSNSLTNKKLLILDARSFTAAFLNRAFGGGSECSEYYPNCEVDYLYLANIHAVRTAFFSLKTLIRSNDNSHYNPPNNYFANWSKSNSNYWLYYISNLIESALKVVQAIDRDARPVLIHCSDGWDRTPLLASLAELMLDPFYRTIQGFRVLVQREWLDFGHKFADRCGVQPVSKNVNERSPIFIQWIDCIYQIIRQCPDYFEFNCTYLEELAFHTYSPLFGTFSCNSYLERFINQIHGETTSVWSYLEKSKDKFINENYVESLKVLEPSYSVSDMTLWTDLYEKLMTEEFESRFDMKNTTQINSNLLLKNQVDVNNQRKKKLFRTYSFTSNLSQSQSLLSGKTINLRKIKSDSDLLSTLKKTITSSTHKQDEQSTPPIKIFQPTNGLAQLRNGNFQHSDPRLDPQPNNHPNYSSNCSLNGTCKFESKTNQNFLNCDSELQYQVPLKVIARIAQVANSNPDSSLLTSVLTYMNTLHTFSVK